MNLAEEFALLAYGEDGTPETDSMHLDNGLGGSLLLELALFERVEIVDKKVVARDHTPTGDPLIDQALARIVADDKLRKPSHWVTKLAKDARKLTLDRLVADEILVREQDKVLFVFNRTKYPTPTGLETPAETEARQRLRAAVIAHGPVEPRTGALCALVAATDLDRKVFRDLDRKQVKARLKEISAGDWAAAAVKKAIEEIQAAVTVAIVASTSATAATA